MEVVAPPTAAPRSRLVDGTTGIQVIKGGLAANAGFIESITGAYTNLVNKPHVLIPLAFLLFLYVAEAHQKEGPLELIDAKLKAIVDDAASLQWEKTLAALLLRITSFITSYKTQFIIIGLYLLPYFGKPSNNNMFVSFILILMAFVTKSWPTFDHVLLSQFYLVYTSVRSPSHKLFILMAALAICFLGVTFQGLTPTPPDSPDGLPRKANVAPPADAPGRVLRSTRRN